ncbi:RNA-directed DNA polymerase, eukaryota, reverse transcriptase zinc-binding domain protein [Tanacetum coccineum]
MTPWFQHRGSRPPSAVVRETTPYILRKENIHRRKFNCIATDDSLSSSNAYRRGNLAPAEEALSFSPIQLSDQKTVSVPFTIPENLGVLVMLALMVPGEKDTLFFLRIKLLAVGHFNPSGSKLRWNNLVPGKINILAWRIQSYRLPTRANINKRGIDLHSILCPFCGEQIEDENHLFALCPFSRNI